MADAKTPRPRRKPPATTTRRLRPKPCPLCKGTGKVTPPAPVTRGLASPVTSAVEGQEGLFEVPDPSVVTAD
ncbi:hypothetical protein [Streptomyces alboflavus]|uniref:hypothetical protein n=1 Tax=Streptomyces alboflavus TaxID=67267 RepID=UPI00367F065F